ncbi:TIGR04149 family rSAM-modified RiPP [Parabacteroides sp. Marseille-P3160]|nr:TIGR04149 family rSAM-modified RiPP [Parabacteroides sp. Marseille-P3160]
MKTKFEKFSEYEMSEEMMSQIKGGGHWKELPDGTFVWLDD